MNGSVSQTVATVLRIALEFLLSKLDPDCEISTNKPSPHLLPAMALLILVLTITAHAQLPPMAPLMPTSQAECQAFSQGVEQYSAEISRQHDACLATSKEDRPNDRDISGICS